MYFVHSFYVTPDDEQVILTETTYGGVKYASSILNKNIFACQFHPEKSAALGLKIYKNWAVLNKLL
jgi:glutamine amidotransferase